MKGYYLYPEIHDDDVAFVSDDDLWVAKIGGLEPRRITVGFGIVSRPKFSPDGRWIAFRGMKGSEQAVAEIYVVPSSGGEARRLTYLGNVSTEVVGWTPNGNVVFSSDWGRPFRGWKELFSVSVEGGEPARLKFGPATAVAFGPKTVLARNSSDLTHWKRYKGGTRGKFWIEQDGSDGFRKFLELDGNLTSPNWVGERLYFVSDHEGIGNLYSVNMRGEDMQKHSDSKEYYVRNASSDGKRIVYHVGGELFMFDPSRIETLKLEYELPSPRKQREPRFVEPTKFLQDYKLHPMGHMLILTTRGKPYLMGNWEGPVKQLGVRNGVRYYHTAFLAEDNKVVTVSDASGEERIEVWYTAADVSKTLDLDLGHIEKLLPSPKNNRVAVSNNRFELFLVDLDTGATKTLDKSEYGIIDDFDWSPGGEWLAYTFPESNHATSIRLVNVDTGEVVRVTSPTASDYSPSFDPDGKYLYYLSYRYLDPVYDKVVFDLGFPKAAKPFLVTLRKSVGSPFNPTPKPPSKDGKAGDQEKPDFSVDVEGIAERVEAFPVDEGDYAKIVGIKGKVVYLSFPVEGAMRRWLFAAGPRTNGVIEAYDLGDLTKDTLISGVTDFKASADRSTLIVRVGDQFRIFRAGEKPDEKAPREPGRKSGWVDIKRLKVWVEPAKEWRQMLRETWRLMRENYWREDLRGLDWEAVYKRYSSLLDRVSTRFELSDVIREMQGELGTSHAYEIGGDYGDERSHPVGGLGADFRFTGEGYEIIKIHEGDPSNEGEKSPLKSAGVGLKEGDVVLAINGDPLSKTLTPQMLLLNRAGEQITLKFKDSTGTREVAVRTLQDERQLLYREWVENNRKHVHDKSNGRLGYVHVPDMGPRGYAEFHRLYPYETERDGLIVDVRYNGGGHVSMLILEKIARKRIGYDKPRRGKPLPYPQDSVKGPLVAITNELAGSDGDIFSHSFKLMGLGPLIGTRTWGGVIGINPRISLVDGTFVTQPQFAFWFKDVGWGVENYGTDPTIEVEIAPQDYAAGVDTQLDRAIEECLRLLDKANMLNEPS